MLSSGAQRNVNRSIGRGYGDITASETPFDYRFATQGDNAPVMLSSGAQRNVNRSIGRGYGDISASETPFDTSAGSV
ncbi:MAG: hypothetical protein KA793_09415 [Bacteroidales bacterium]|nr:hypothetical protein [Bacteroidales bacterium]